MRYRKPSKRVRLPSFQKVSAAELGRQYEVAFLRRDIASCRRILKKVLLADPANVQAKLLGARLYGVQCRFVEARDAFLKTVNGVPVEQRNEVASRAGQLARDLYDPSIAETLYRIATSTRAPVGAHVHFAEHLAKMRRRDEALESIETELRMDPENANALLLKAKLGGSEKAESEGILRSLAKRSDLELETQVRVGYELAKWLDHQGDYDQAMEVLLESKAKLRERAAPFIQARPAPRKRFTDLSEAITPEADKRWKSERYRPLNGLDGIGMIVGHPRSGTTLLEQIVDSHSQTESAEETENFSNFALSPLLDKPLARGVSMFDALDRLMPEAINSARKDYRRTLGKVLAFESDTSLLIDKNPSLSPVIGAFVRVFPEARILAMIRDPRDVVLSCFFQPMLPLNPVTSCYTELTETAIEYAAVMGAFSRTADVLGESVMQVQYEDLVDNVERISREVLEFFGLPWDASVLDFHQRAQTRVVRSPTADAVTENVHGRAINRWKNYERHFEPCMDVLDPFLDRWDYR